MRIGLFLAGIGVLLGFSASAQNNWVDAGMPYQCAGIRQLYSDTANDQLIACGLVTLTDNFAATPLVVYSNDSWDTLGLFDGLVYSVIRFGDTLFVAGSFHHVNGAGADLIAGYYAGSWHNFPGFSTANGNIRKLRSINGMLYAVGFFDEVSGHACHGLARRVGNNWENVGAVPYVSGAEPIVLDVCEYQGSIVVGGEINPIGMGSDIIQFDGTTWSSVGGGIIGGAGSVTSLEVYDGELYVGGGISVEDGNAGHGLMRWDGNEWHDVGGSMRDVYGTTQYNASANSFMLHDGKLFVGGSFGYAGDIQASKFAVWDGIRWCATEDSLSGRVESMAYYHDTLYVTCWDSLHGEPANYIAKWTGGTLEQVCGSGVGISELPEPGRMFTIGPDLNGQRMIQGLPDGHYELTIHDVMGKVIGTQHVLSNNGKAHMQLPAIAVGLYIVRIQGKAFRGTARFIAEQ